jgi:hypothetical protein
MQMAQKVRFSHLRGFELDFILQETDVKKA